MAEESAQQTWRQGSEWSETVQYAPVSRNRAGIPGPSSPPLLDWRFHLLPLLIDPVVGMLKLQRQYGDVVALGRSDSAPVLILSPEYTHQLLTNTSLFYSFDVNRSGAPIKMPPGTAATRLLSGVASMNGDRHREHRRMLMPAFHRKRVDGLRDALVDCIEEHIAGWEDEQPRDLVHEMIELALALDVKGLLGLPPGEDGRRMQALLEAWGTSALSIPVNVLPVDLPGMPFREFLRICERVEAELKIVIARKRAQMQSGTDGGDALTILLEVYDAQEELPAVSESGTTQMTESQLLGHLATLFSSGHETTASALSWTLFLLAQHPQMAADLLDELEGTLHGAAPTLEQLGQLPLLEHVINESMRLFPPGMWMLRTSTGPFDVGPYHLPAETHIVYSPAVIHRQPDLYPDPHRFLPRRWETIDPSPYEYLPFGAGQRRCLGATFALLELRLVVAVIMQRFRLAVPDGTKVDRGGTVLSFPRSPGGGLPVVVHKQDRRFRAARLRGNIHALLEPARPQ